MKLFGIRTPKPRKYSVKPVFYDPVKEAQESRLKEPGYSESKPGSELRMRMQLRMNRKTLDERKRRQARTMRVLFTLLLLLLILYFIFF